LEFGDSVQAPAGPRSSLAASDSACGAASLPPSSQIIFDEAIRRGNSGCPAPMVSLSEQFPQEPRRPVPEQGTIRIEGFDFPQQFSEFSFKTLLTKVRMSSMLVCVLIFVPASDHAKIFVDDGKTKVP
jgi:hypothetical protein